MDLGKTTACELNLATLILPKIPRDSFKPRMDYKTSSRVQPLRANTSSTIEAKDQQQHHHHQQPQPQPQPRLHQQEQQEEVEEQKEKLYTNTKRQSLIIRDLELYYTDLCSAVNMDSSQVTALKAQTLYKADLWVNNKLDQFINVCSEVGMSEVQAKELRRKTLHYSTIYWHNATEFEEEQDIYLNNHLLLSCNVSVNLEPDYEDTSEDLIVEKENDNTMQFYKLYIYS
eukprot:Pgem_evm1s14750